MNSSALQSLKGITSAIPWESPQSHKFRRLVSAIWTAIARRKLTYAEPPASFETRGQKIRFPDDVSRQGLATCLDTALLFAGAIEQAGLHPLMAFTKGHAFCGAWLQPLWRDNQDESGATIKMRRSGRMVDDCRWPRVLQAD